MNKAIVSCLCKLGTCLGQWGQWGSSGGQWEQRTLSCNIPLWSYLVKKTKSWSV